MVRGQPSGAVGEDLPSSADRVDEDTSQLMVMVDVAPTPPLVRVGGRAAAAGTALLAERLPAAGARTGRLAAPRQLRRTTPSASSSP